MPLFEIYNHSYYKICFLQLGYAFYPCPVFAYALPGELLFLGLHSIWAHHIPLLRNCSVTGLFGTCSASKDALSVIIMKQKPAVCLWQTQAEQQPPYPADPLCAMQYVMSRGWNSGWLTAASQISAIARKKAVYLYTSQRGRKFEFLTPTACFTNLSQNTVILNIV